MNHRIDRLNSDMQRVISDIIEHRLKDPRVTELVSVTSVSIARDLKTAKVYLSIFGDKDRAEITFNTIVKCSGYIRSELAKEFRDIRCIPELEFLIDASMEYSRKIEGILKGLHENDK